MYIPCVVLTFSCNVLLTVQNVSVPDSNLSSAAAPSHPEITQPPRGSSSDINNVSAVPDADHTLAAPGPRPPLTGTTQDQRPGLNSNINAPRSNEAASTSREVARSQSADLIRLDSPFCPPNGPNNPTIVVDSPFVHYNHNQDSSGHILPSSLPALTPDVRRDNR
jgi:hypothetical protein